MAEIPGPSSVVISKRGDGMPAVSALIMRNGEPASGAAQGVLAVETQVRRLIGAIAPTEQPAIVPTPGTNS